MIIWKGIYSWKLLDATAVSVTSELLTQQQNETDFQDLKSTDILLFNSLLQKEEMEECLF